MRVTLFNPDFPVFRFREWWAGVEPHFHNRTSFRLPPATPRRKGWREGQKKAKLRTCTVCCYYPFAGAARAILHESEANECLKDVVVTGSALEVGADS